MLTAFPIPVWADKLICILFYFAIGYVLIQLNNTFGLIRTRASVQTSAYYILFAACPVLQNLYPGVVATLLFILAIYLLFATYQKARSSGYLFHTFLFIGLASLIFPHITLLAPVLLMGAFNFQSLNLRSFCAAILGWSVPYWFLLGHAYYYDNMALLYQPFIELATFYPIRFSDFQTWQLVTLGYSFILFLVGTIHSFAQSYKDKIRARVHLRFFILLNVFIYLLIFLQPVHCTNLLPLLFIGVSILVSHMFVLTKSRGSNILFICTIIGLISLFAFNIWTQL